MQLCVFKPAGFVDKGHRVAPRYRADFLIGRLRGQRHPVDHFLDGAGGYGQPEHRFDELLHGLPAGALHARQLADQRTNARPVTKPLLRGHFGRSISEKGCLKSMIE